MTHEPPTTTAGAPTWLGRLLAMLEERFGCTASSRQIPALSQQITDAVGHGGSESPEQLVHALSTRPLHDATLQAIVQRVVVKDSYFFRDEATVESLRSLVLPMMIERAARTRRLRVWSAGCATGEELFTFSVLLHELLPERERWQVELLGSDLDASAILRAQNGVYGTWSLRATPDAERERHFERLESGFRIKDCYRRDVRFELRNLLERVSPSPAPFDLILCRNVSRYLNAGSHARLHETLRRSLSPDGLWVADPCDAAPDGDWTTGALPGLHVHVPTRRALATRPGAPKPTLAEPTPSPARLFAPALETRLTQPSTATRFSEPIDPPMSAPQWEMRATAAQLRLHAERARSRAHTSPALPRSKSSQTGMRRTVRAPDVSGRIEKGTLDAEALSLSLCGARAHVDMGRLDTALAEVARLAELHPLSAEVQRMLGILHAEAGELEPAVDALKRAVHLDPNDADSHLRLGQLLHKLGAEVDAVRALRKAVALGGGDELQTAAAPARLAAQLLNRLVERTG